MFLLNILEAVLAYDLVEIRLIKEKEVILNGNTNDKSRGTQLIGPGYLQKVIKGVNWLLSPIVLSNYEGESIGNQPIPFSMDRDGHDFHALFQYMFYTWVQNCTPIESFFNKILNVKHG